MNPRVQGPLAVLLPRLIALLQRQSTLLNVPSEHSLTEDEQRALIVALEALLAGKELEQESRLISQCVSALRQIATHRYDYTLEIPPSLSRFEGLAAAIQFLARRLAAGVPSAAEGVVNADSLSGNAGVDVLPHAFLRTDHQGSIAYVNAAAARIIGQGLSAAQMLNRNLLDLLPPHYCLAMDGVTMRESLTAADFDQSQELLLGFDPPFGNVSFLAMRIDVPFVSTASTGTQGGVSNAAVIIDFCDVSAFEEAKRILLFDFKMGAGSDLASHIIHDINNPLTAIRGGVDIIGDIAKGPASDLPAINQFIPSIMDGCRRISGLMAGLQSVTRDSGALTPEPVSVAELVANIVNFTKAKLVARGITISANIPEDLMTLVNPAQLGQAVFLLLANSREATESLPQRWIKIEASRVAANLPPGIHRANAVNQECIEISVEDSGPGIAADIRSKVFRAFFTTKSAQGGKGLGLYFARRLAQLNSGELILDEASAHTRFVLRIPKI
jgi:signal transduction histidine kinase